MMALSARNDRRKELNNMSKMHHAKSVIAACIAAWALVACGWQDPVAQSSTGTGTGGSTGFSGQDASAPLLTNNIGVDGRAWINYRRNQIGLSTLTENTIIDRAAQGHSNYQSINNVVTHDQTPGKPGFTGITLEDRLKAAGYIFGSPNAIGEVIAATQSQSGFYMAEQLITAIYHRFVIFEPVFQEIGSGSAVNASGYGYFTADFVTNNGYGAGLPAGTLAVWPFNGQTGVPASFSSDSEEPDPVPDLDLVGYPISVHVNLTSKLTVQSFTVRARNGSANLPTRLLVQGQDANTTSPSVAAIIPLSVLDASTVYDVSFSGAIDGSAISKTWSFTTQ
jgi:uncharacterized protein YkwD